MTFHPVTIGNKWKKILEKVYDTSNNSNMDIKLGSALLYGGKIVNTGTNINNRTQWNGISMPCVHAEMSAVNSISYRCRYKSVFTENKPFSRGKGWCQKGGKYP